MRNDCPCEGSHKSERLRGGYTSPLRIWSAKTAASGTENILTNGALKLALSINVSSTLAEVASQTRKPRVLGTVNLSGFK